jgi:tetratricopeptide (TPR) repeat protein
MFEEAIEDYKEVLVEDRFNPLALYNIGNNYMNLGLYDEAVSYFEKTLEAKPSWHYKSFDGSVQVDKYSVTFPEIYFGLGYSFFKLEKFDSSLYNFKKCQEYDYDREACREYIRYIYSVKNKK